MLRLQGELNLEEGNHFHDRPPLDIVINKFRAAKITAYVAGLFFTLLFVGIWPGSMLTLDVLDNNGFLVWTTLSRGWAFVAAAFIIIVPLVQEFQAIIRQHRQNQMDAAAAAEDNEGKEDQDPQAASNGKTLGVKIESANSSTPASHKYGKSQPF